MQQNQHEISHFNSPTFKYNYKAQDPYDFYNIRSNSKIEKLDNCTKQMIEKVKQSVRSSINSSSAAIIQYNISLSKIKSNKKTYKQIEIHQKKISNVSNSSSFEFSSKLSPILKHSSVPNLSSTSTRTTVKKHNNFRDQISPNQTTNNKEYKTQYYNPTQINKLRGAAQSYLKKQLNYLDNLQVSNQFSKQPNKNLSQNKLKQNIKQSIKTSQQILQMKKLDESFIKMPQFQKQINQIPSLFNNQQSEQWRKTNNCNRQVDRQIETKVLSQNQPTDYEKVNLQDSNVKKLSTELFTKQILNTLRAAKEIKDNFFFGN